MSILHDLVFHENSLERILELLRAGENPNSLDEDGNTPLHNASLKVTSPQNVEENLRVARELIKFGAEVDKRNRFGYSPLHYAVFRHKLEMVQYLLQENADINIQSYRNFTPLMLAAKFRNFQIVKELLNQHASVNLQDSRGNSAMHYVLCHKSVNVKMVVELLRHGCEHNIRNLFYKMPLELYINKLDRTPNHELWKAIYLLKFFSFQSSNFKTQQLKIIKFIDRENQSHLHRFYKHLREEIVQIKNDFLAPDFTVYAIGLRGFNYSLPKINKLIPFEIYDKVLERLIKGKYPLYSDIIVSGICTTYLKKKFADECCCTENRNREFLNFDALYLISYYLSHLDMLNVMIAFSTG